MSNENNNVHLKVNAVNQLIVFRNSTFKDPESFLDENCQNATRSGASEFRVHVDYWGRRVTCWNNGAVLEDPQKLFSIAESGWDQDIIDNENPFGMGFFSNTTVSNYIEVYSGYRHVVFDVDKMIATRDTSVIVNEVEEYFDGFKLILHNFEFSKVSESKIHERAEMLGRYSQKIEVYYNDLLQERRDLTAGDDSPFQLKILTDKSFTGWLSLSRSFSSSVRVFYNGRLVKKLDDLYYLSGDLHVTDRTLNLTAPDRKDIIDDEKFRTFRTKIKEYANDLVFKAVMEGDVRELDQYADAITYHGNKKQLKDIVRFVTFKGSKDADMKYLSGVALVKKDRKGIENFDDYETAMKELSDELLSSEVVEREEVTFSEAIEYRVPEPRTRDFVLVDTYSPSTGTISTSKEDDTYAFSNLTSFTYSKDHPTFWLEFKDLDLYETKLTIVRHYNLDIIVARNRFESEILRFLESENNLAHIGVLEEDVRFDVTLSNRHLNDREKRASMLLGMLSRMAGLSESVFVIGDLLVQKTVSINPIGREFSSIEDNIVAIRNSAEGAVYVDRLAIDTSALEANLLPDLTMSDLRFILRNLNDLVEQMALLNRGSKDLLLKNVLTALAAY